MTDFSDLPIKGGVGDYDLNRFRVAFRSDYGARYLGALLVGSFPGYFNGPAATVERDGDRLKFHGNLKVRGHYVPTPHPDWVRTILKDPERGFVVQTLHRDSWAADDVAAGAGGGLGGLIGAAEAGRVNRYHFLAGRRGWRVDDVRVFNFPNVSPCAKRDRYRVITAHRPQGRAHHCWITRQRSSESTRTAPGSPWPSR